VIAAWTVAQRAAAAQQAVTSIEPLSVDAQQIYGALSDADATAATSFAQFQGFEIDLLHGIAAAIFGNPDQIRFKPLHDAQRIPALRTGAVDIVAQDFVISCARLNLIDFSSPYLDSGQEVQSDSPFKHVTSLGQLAGGPGPAPAHYRG